jgi:hypothetical protein
MTRSEKATPAQARDEAMRTVLRAITATDHRGVQRETARVLGIAPSTLNGYVNGREGNTVIGDAVALYLGRSIDEIVAAGGDLERIRTPKPRDPSKVEVTFGELPAWPSLLDQARRIAPHVPEWAWRDTAESIVWMRPPITPAKVAGVAGLILAHEPPHA